MMNIVINIDDTSIPEGISNIVGQLPTSNNLSEEDVTIVLRFSGHYVYQTGLVLLATWRKTLPNHVMVLIDDTDCEETTKRLLTNTGFRELIEDNAEGPSKIHYYPGKVPLQPIIRGFSTEMAISKIVDIFNQYADDWIDMKAFRVLLSELCENAYAHSGFETPGYIAANLHSGTGKCEIAIADSGIGILTSYLEGTNEEAKQRIENGASAIALAVDGLSSSKPVSVTGTFPSYYGFGLFIVKRLIEENMGRLTIVSGDECFNFEKYQKNRNVLEKGWNGTFVGILIDVSNPLPLEEIYEEGAELIGPVDDQPEQKQLISQESFNLAKYGPQLLTRELGIAIRADVATLLAKGSKVEVDLTGIEDLTPSVADEVFGKIAEALGKDRFDRYVNFSGGSPLLKRLIEFVISSRFSEKDNGG